MSIRLRLTLWYGLLTALVLLLTALFSYAFHSRAHYDDLDRALLSTAEHAVSELEIENNLPHFAEQTGALDIALRLYDEQGTLVETAPDILNLPPTEPAHVLSAPSGPAFDVIASLAPALMPEIVQPFGGEFGLIRQENARWRLYVLPVRDGGSITGYVEAITPLTRLDRSMFAFRRLLIALGAASLILGIAGSWATSSAALRPISQMIRTAETITHSRDLSKRIEPPAARDELNQLATAFNSMLASLEEAYRAQQRFVSDASHELRAPLTAIQANLELLERHPTMAVEDREEALREASREAHRLTRLVADLLALARADAGTALPRQPVDLDRVVGEAASDARHLLAGHVLDTSIAPLRVSGNMDRLKQLVLILLDNAIKYTPNGGRIEVMLSRQGAHAVLVVRDTGVGIPQESLPHLFERFYRADPARARDPGGTGLGLAIAKWIVDQHEGQISVDSTLGKGTAITVRLPLA